MSDEIFFNGVRYISAQEAANASNLTRDYIARLCRDNKVRGRRVGKNWYVDEGSLKGFLIQQEYAKSKRHEELTEQRLKEYKSVRVPVQKQKFSEEKDSASTKELRELPFEKKNTPSLLRPRAFNVQEKIARAVASSEKSLTRVSKMTRTPGALDSAVHSYASYALSPAVEFLHKLTALTVAFMLTFGTYSFVDPQYAAFVRDSLYDTGDAISDSYIRVTKGGVLDMFARANTQLAAVANNPGAIAEQVSNVFVRDIPLFVRQLARGVNTKIDGLVYAIAFPDSILESRERAAVSIMVGPRNPSIVSTQDSTAREADFSGTTANAGGVVVERVREIERIVTAGGISEAVLNAKLESLDNKLSSKMYSLSSANSTSITNVYNTVARTNRIDTLGDVDISNSRWTGGTITGASITASDFSVTGNATVTGSLDVSGVSTFGTAVSTTASSSNALFTNATSTFLTATYASTTNATSTNLFATRASTTEATSTYLYATAFVAEAATSTNSFFSALSRFTTSIVTTLTAAVGTITDLTSTNLSATNATTTSATTTSLAIFTAPIAPTYTATSTAATSTFSGGFSAASSLYVLQNGRVGVGTATPTPAAIFQINSTSGGFLPPRLTTAQKTAIASPASGLVLYDSDLNKLNVYNGSAWKNVGNPEIDGEVTNGTAQSVLFVGQGGILGQDQNHFTYSTSTRSLGVGTSSPYAKISIQGNSNDTTVAQTLFAVASSTATATSTHFSILNTGNVGVGTSSPSALFSVHGNVLIAGTTTLHSIVATSTLWVGGTTGSYLKVDGVGNVGIGTSTPGTPLSVTGAGVFTGPVTAPYFYATSTSATSTFAGGFVSSRAPTSAHTFSSWAIGAANSKASDATLVVNPNTSVADGNLISASVGEAVRFLVDAEGDVFLNNLTSTGAVTLSTTTASTFTVENNTTFGDAITDASTINGTLVVTGTTTVATVAGNFGVATTSPWAKLSVHANNGEGNSVLFAVASSTATATTTLFSVPNSTSATSTFATNLQATALNITSTSASSTFANGINISAGCLSLNGTCLGSQLDSLKDVTITAGAYGDLLMHNGTDWVDTATSSLFANSAQLALWLSDETGTGVVAYSASPTFTGTVSASSILATASSTIGAGGQATGLTISGGATTTSNHYFASNIGVGTTSPYAPIALESTTNPLLVVGPGSNTTVDPTIYLTDTEASAGFKLWYDNDGGSTYFDNKWDNDSGSMYFRTKVDGTDVNALSLLAGGNVGISTTTPQWNLQVAGTRPSIAISDTAAATNNQHWLLSSQNGNLYIGTSTNAYATSSPAVLSLSGSATSTFALGVQTTALNITSTSASSTFANGINISAGCLSLNGTCLGSQLDSLKDVTITAAAYGDLLMHNGTDWVDTATSSLFANSAQLALWLSDETGTGNVVYSASPTFTGTAIFANTRDAEATSTTSVFTPSIKSFTAVFGQSASSSFSSAGVLTLASDLAVSEGGTGAGTLTGLLQGNGTSAFTVVTDSSTVGQLLRVTGASAYGWGALDLADTDAVTGILPIASGGTNASVLGNHMLTSFDGTRLVSTSTPTFAAIFATSTTATSTFASVISVTGPSTSTFAGGLAVETSGLVYDYSTNRVGIGTANPDNLLTLYANANETAVKIQNDKESFRLSTGGNDFSIYDDDGSGGGIILKDSGNVLLAPNSGNVGIGTSTPNWLLQVAGTRPSIAISDTAAATNNQHWLLSSQNGNLYIGTSTNAYATSSPAVLSLSGSATSTFALGVQTTALNITSTSASSTFANGINISAGCLSLNGTCLGSQLDSLKDVTITAAAYGDLLMHNGTDWVDTATSSLFANSAQLALWLSDETGTGVVAYSASPTFTGTAVFANLRATEATSTSLYGASFKSNLAFFGQTATSSFDSAGALTLASVGGSMLTSFDASRTLVSTSTPTLAALLATSTTATSSFAGPLSIGSTTPNGAHLFSIGTSSPLLTVNNSTGNVNVYGKATTTFSQGIESTALNITSTSASSTFANGINLSAGCLSLNGTCLGSQLDSLKDVTITAGAYGDLLMHNGTDWVDTATSSLFANSAQLALWLSDETGTGVVAYSASPTFTGTTIFANTRDAEATSTTSVFTPSIKSFTATFGQSASSSFSSAGVLTLASDLAVSEGGTGASTLTGLLQGNGTSAFTVVTDSSTVGQLLRVTGASAYGWGALDLADTDAVTGILPIASGGTNASVLGNHMLTSFDGTRLVSTSTPTLAALLATSTTATSSFAGPLSIGSTTPNGAHLFSIGTSSPLFTINNSTGNVNIYGKATTTFSQGIESTALNITSTSASSTFANGIQLTSGCFRLPSGECAGTGGGGSGTVGTGAVGQFAYYAAAGTTLTATSSIFVATNENVGLGTTTPQWDFQVAGTRPSIAISDTSASTNNQHWLLSSQNGNLYIGTSTNAYATSTPAVLSLSGSASSTFARGLTVPTLEVTSTSASSTFANGIQLTGGCFLNRNGQCVDNSTSVTLSQVVASSSPGSNTSFTVPTNTAYIIVETWGAGGGGSGNSGGGAGGSGGQSCFGTNATACTSPELSATGGTGPSSGAGGGAGGVGSGGDINMTGGGGGSLHTSGDTNYDTGGWGGSAPNGGGGGAAGATSGAGGAGAAFGGGGAGGSLSAGVGAGTYSGTGGGAGGYSKEVIENPSGTYYYTVGAGGAGGTAGADGTAGGAGGAGGVIIYVYTTQTLTSSGSGVTLTRVVTASAAASNVSYTPPSNISYIEVEVWGSGGGGGGGKASANYHGGGGGGGGGYSQKIITAPSGTYYYTVGAGGAAGATGNAGSTGNQSCFGTNSTACTSPSVQANGGGAGGVGGGGGGSSGGAAGTGGAVGTGDLIIKGGDGDSGDIGTASQLGPSGRGGSAPRGGAGGGADGFEQDAGTAGSPFGGGGGGGGGNLDGNAGGAGGIVIKEYTTGAATAGSVGTGTQGQFAFYNADGANLTATSTLTMAQSGAITATKGIDLTGGCFSVNGVCIGYVKGLVGIYATSTPGSNVQVTKSSAGLAFSSGALTIPAPTTEMVVEVWGGGGGGGSDCGGTPGNGGVGGTSSFGNGTGIGLSTTTATGGSGGSQCTSNKQSGGVGAGGSGSGGDVNLQGNAGSIGGSGDLVNWTGRGGSGGSAPRGGGGGQEQANGSVFGGGGGGAQGTGAGAGGGGGSGGGYTMKTITAPSGTYYYNIGAAGTSGDGVAGTGGAGGIVITVYATSSPTAAGNDYAEMFPVSNPSISAGDIVAVDVGTPVSMTLAAGGSSHALAGIIATQPGQILGDINATGQRPVALAGRVPTKVNLEGGPIYVGDRIAPSSVPGVGKRAGVFEDSVGIAIDNYPSAGNSPEPTPEGTVMVFINLQSSPTLKMIGEGLLHSAPQSLGENAYDFVADLMQTIAGRLTSTNTPLTGAGLSAQAGLESVRSFNTVYNPYLDFGNSNTVASSTDSALSVLTASTTSALFDYLDIVPSLAKGIGELDARTAFIDNAFGTSTVMWIDANGNIGLGTSTPQYKLHVLGDIAASSFVVTGSSDMFGELASFDFDAATFETFASSTTPLEILSLSGDGVDLYKLGIFTFAGLKSLDRKVGALASTTIALGLRVESLESAMNDLVGRSSATSTLETASETGSLSLAATFDALKALGAEIVDGLTRLAYLVVEQLAVGSPEKPTGITLYDKATGEPYCFAVENGSATTSPGLCAAIPQVAGAASAAAADNGEATSTVPMISIQGANPATIQVGTTYADLGALITGPTTADTNLGIHTFLDGVAMEPISLDTSTSGTHTIVYVATNDSGTATSTRTVIIEAPAGTETTSDPGTGESTGTTGGDTSNATTTDNGAGDGTDTGAGDGATTGDTATSTPDGGAGDTGDTVTSTPPTDTATSTTP